MAVTKQQTNGGTKTGTILNGGTFNGTGASGGSKSNPAGQERMIYKVNSQYPTNTTFNGTTYGAKLTATPISNGSSSGSSGGSSGSGTGGSTPTYDPYQEYDLNDYIKVLTEQLNNLKSSQMSNLEAKYKQAVSEQNASNQANVNQINLSAKNTLKRLNQMYGGENSGSSISNKLRANTNWNNNLTSAYNTNQNALKNLETDYLNNVNSAESNFMDAEMNYIYPLYNQKFSSQLARAKAEQDAERDWQYYLKKYKLENGLS